jgi:hypothetical protein
VPLHRAYTTGRDYVDIPQFCFPVCLARDLPPRGLIRRLFESLGNVFFCHYWTSEYVVLNGAAGSFEEVWSKDRSRLPEPSFDLMLEYVSDRSSMRRAAAILTRLTLSSTCEFQHEYTCWAPRELWNPEGSKRRIHRCWTSLTRVSRESTML